MKKSILFFSILVSGLGLAAYAGIQDPSTTATQPQQTFTVCSPPNEQERLAHDAEMLADMKRREAQVEADNARTRAYYKQFADAEAKKWQNPTERVPNQVIVAPNGVTRVYNNP